MSDLYKSISLIECAKLIGAIGKTQTVLAMGEMGIGKSSMLKMLAKDFPDYYPCYVDMTTKDVGDFLIPKIRDVNGVEVCSFIPNEEFGFHLDKPVIIMLDEIGKCNKAVMNASLCLMQERRLGVFKLLEGSIVFATTNLTTESLGDNVPPHARNRQVRVKVRKPSADEWIEWALDNNISPEVLLTVKQFPQMLASFEDYSKPSDNEYINDPRTPRDAVCTPRTLEKASDIIKFAKPHGIDIMAHALKGTIGNRATYDMLSIIQLSDELPDWETIIKDPEKVAIPSSPSAVCMLIYSAIQQVEKSTISKFMKFLTRLSKEQQGLFATSVMRTSKKTTIGTNADFIKFATANNYLFKQD